MVYTPGAHSFHKAKLFLYSLHSYSRIDYFFIDKTLLSNVSKIEYLAIVQSDHGPVKLGLTFSLRSTHPPWRVDTTLLVDKEFYKLISEKIDDFF